MTTLYGIKNCDSVRKAKRWLEQHEITYDFHDFRTDGLSAPLIDQWFKLCTWQTLLNKRSTTWKTLSDHEKSANSATTAKQLMLAHPTLIKRPVLCADDQLIVGFKETDYAAFFSS